MSDELNYIDFMKGGETYLITGANGFIGRSIVFRLMELNKNLLDRPCKIILAVRDEGKAVEIYGELLKSKNIEMLVFENEDELIIEQEIHWIICAAAVTSKLTFKERPVETLWSNVLGIYHCLKLAKEKGVKGIVFVSSVQVYGSVRGSEIREDIFGPLDCMEEAAVYPESKRMGEMLCRAYYKEYAVPAKCIRLFHVYGENEQYNNGTFLSDFMNDIMEGKNIVIQGTGNEMRNLLYITDAVNAILLVLYKGEAGQAYNAGSEVCNYSIKEIAELLCRIVTSFEKECSVVIKNKAGDSIVEKQIPDVSKLKALGWKELRAEAEVNFREMIQLYLERSKR